MVKWGTFARVCACVVNVATRTHVRDLYTGIARKSKSRRRIREGGVERSRQREIESRGGGKEEGGRRGPRKSSRSNSICVCACSVRVCIKDRWLVRTQLNESKADYAAGLEPHKSSI